MAEGTVSTVHDDTKINSIEKLVVSAPSYEKITGFLDEYEICNTVKFTVATKAATFNANYCECHSFYKLDCHVSFFPPHLKCITALRIWSQKSLIAVL